MNIQETKISNVRERCSNVSFFYKDGKKNFVFDHLLGNGSASIEIDENPKAQKRQEQAADVLFEMNTELNNLKERWIETSRDLSWKISDLTKYRQVNGARDTRETYVLKSSIKKLNEIKKDLSEQHDHIKVQRDKIRRSYD